MQDAIYYHPLIWISALAAVFLAARRMPVAVRILKELWREMRPKRAFARFRRAKQDPGPPPVIRYGIDHHWHRVTAILAEIIARHDRAMACHAEARRRIEAAEYSLTCLLDELAGVMQVEQLRTVPATPPDRVGLQGAASRLDNRVLAA